MISHSDSITNLMAAMLLVQGEVEGVRKDAQNPHFRKPYASLESVVDAIRDPCQRAGLVVMQAPGECKDGMISVETMIAHAKSGEWIRSVLSLPLEKAGPQGAGSALTYGERYSLMAMFNLPPIDDDGEGATRRESSRPAPAEPQRDPYADIVSGMLEAITNISEAAKLDKLATGARFTGDLANLPDAHRERVEKALRTRRLTLSNLLPAG